MSNLVLELYEKREQLAEMIQRAQQRMEKAPEGSLDIRRRGAVPSYYHVRGRKKQARKRTYLKSEEVDLIKSLAQKSYDQKFLKAAQKQYQAIDRFLRNYDEKVLEQLYASLTEERRKLISAEVLDDAAFVERWEAVTYEPGIFKENAPEYYTMKGERVRSKTELLIANILFSLGIPYRYEYPIQMQDGKVWRPDFIVLNVRTRKEYILEHFGMMDDPDYCNDALGKLQIYAKNQIYPGERLIISAESKSKPFSNREFEALAKHYFL